MGEEEEAVQGYSQVSGLTTWSANGGIMNWANAYEGEWRGSFEDVDDELSLVCRACGTTKGTKSGWGDLVWDTTADYGHSDEIVPTVT